MGTCYVPDPYIEDTMVTSMHSLKGGFLEEEMSNLRLEDQIGVSQTKEEIETEMVPGRKGACTKAQRRQVVWPC